MNKYLKKDLQSKTHTKNPVVEFVETLFTERRKLLIQRGKKFLLHQIPFYSDPRNQIQKTGLGTTRSSHTHKEKAFQQQINDTHETHLHNELQFFSNIESINMSIKI